MHLDIHIEYIPVDGVEETFLRYRDLESDDRTFRMVALGRVYELTAATEEYLKMAPTKAPATDPIEAFKYFRHIAKIASDIHKTSGRISRACLDPLFQGMEGKRVQAIDIKGDMHRFNVERGAGYMPIYLNRINARCANPIPAGFLIVREVE